MILSSLAAALAPANLLYLLAGSVLGILIGAAPGLGPVFGLAILLSMTFSMPVEGALIFLSAVYAASVYGGSITAILLNTPGTPALWRPVSTASPSLNAVRPAELWGSPPWPLSSAA